MRWRVIPGDVVNGRQVGADCSVSGDYVISHRTGWFTCSYRPEGHHECVGNFDTLTEAKKGASEHARHNRQED